MHIFFFNIHFVCSNDMTEQSSFFKIVFFYNIRCISGINTTLSKLQFLYKRLCLKLEISFVSALYLSKTLVIIYKGSLNNCKYIMFIFLAKGIHITVLFRHNELERGTQLLLKQYLFIRFWWIEELFECQQ